MTFCLIYLFLLISTMSAESLTVPRRAPNYGVSLSNSETITLSSLKGNVIVLAFLNATCPSCQKTAEVLEKCFRTYGPNGLRVIGVIVNDDGTGAATFIEKYQITYPIGFNSRTSAYKFLLRDESERLPAPQMVIIDRKGIIRLQVGGGDTFFSGQEQNLIRAVQPLLNEQASR